MRVEIDEANNLVAIEPETPEQRDSLLRGRTRLQPGL